MKLCELNQSSMYAVNSLVSWLHCLRKALCVFVQVIFLIKTLAHSHQQTLACNNIVETIQLQAAFLQLNPKWEF